MTEQCNISNKTSRSNLDEVLDDLVSSNEANAILVRSLMAICVEYHGARFRKLLLDQLYLASQLDDHAVADRVARMAEAFMPMMPPPAEPEATGLPTPAAPTAGRKRFHWRDTTRRGRRQG